MKGGVITENGKTPNYYNLIEGTRQGRNSGSKHDVPTANLIKCDCQLSLSDCERNIENY